GLRRVGEETDRDEIDAGFGIGANAFEADATGALDGYAPSGFRATLNGATNVFDVHVVEQDGLCTDVQGLFQFVKIAELDLDWLRAPAIADGPVKRGNDATRQCDVVVLDKNPVGKIETVVHPSPASHCILVDDTQTGSGLARVEDSRFRAGDGVDKFAGQRGD